MTKSIKISCLVLLFFITNAYSQAIPTLTCSTDGSILSTGLDAMGNVQSPNLGLVDAQWDAGFGDASGPASVATYSDAFVARVGAWAASPLASAEWISNFSNTSQNVPNQDFYYRYQFNLDPAVPPNTLDFNLDFLVDNAILEIYVNGVPQSASLPGIPQGGADPYFFTGFLIGNLASITLPATDWQTGMNELIVQVASAPTNVGFLAEFSGDAICGQVISVNKTVDAGAEGIASPGETLAYTISFTNDGGAPQNYAAGEIIEFVPAGTSHAGGDDFTCAATTAGSTCSNTNAVTVPGQLGGISGELSLYFNVVVDSPLAASILQITNSVIVPGDCPDVSGGVNNCDVFSDVEAQGPTAPVSVNTLSSLSIIIMVLLLLCVLQMHRRKNSSL